MSDTQNEIKERSGILFKHFDGIIMFDSYHQSRSLNEFQHDEVNLFDTILDFNVHNRIKKISSINIYVENQFSIRK